MHVIQRILVFMLVMCCDLTHAQYQETCLKEDQEGLCVPLGQCRYLMAQIRAAGSAGPIADKLKRLNCGYSRNQPRVCCMETPGTEKPENSSVPHTSSPLNPGELRTLDRGKHSSEPPPPDVSKHRNLGLLPAECGSLDEDRIIRGKRVNLFELPWMVLFAYSDVRSGDISYKCGGTLISRWYVLTAAHCVSLASNSFTLDHVVLGEHDVRTNPDCEYHEADRLCTAGAFNHTIETTIVHPDYTSSLHGNDIALLKLKNPANITLESIKPICLPLTPELQRETLVGKNGAVAGWGTTEDGDASPVLNSVGITVITNEECEEYFKGYPKITSNQLCTLGDKGQDTCTGDSGGPLAYPGFLGETQKQVQRAIVSYGAKQCAVKGHPSVYTNIAYYMKWILDRIDQ